MLPMFRNLAFAGILLPSAYFACTASCLATVIAPVCAAFMTVSCAHAQATYDVSTVKPAKPGQSGMMLDWDHAELNAKNVTLVWLMTTAFHARTDQITDLPSWAKEQPFDIVAKLIETDAVTVEKMTTDQHRALLLALLIERFGLKYHLQTKELPVYDLESAKNGLKLTPAANSGDKTKSVYGQCSGCTCWGGNQVIGHDIDVSTVAELLAVQLGRSVIDRTGFTGKIDVNVRWAPDLGAEPVSEEDAVLPPLPMALEKQMGLRLVSGIGTVKLYVIDRLDKPSAN